MRSREEEEGMQPVRRQRRAGTSLVTCEDCGASDAIQIELTLPDGTAVNFHSCHRCEHRWWDSDGEVIDLTTVLERARRPS
jgi:DNA-directed RNA polymerase subunit M/transcription elongation factor TFIIS